MTDNYPITPPPELVKQWWKEAQRADYSDGLPCWLNYVATQAARWGADQELEACCGWLDDTDCDDPQEVAQLLRVARRPKPPSLKEQALAALATADGADQPVVCTVITADQHAIIRRALEQLDD